METVCQRHPYAAGICLSKFNSRQRARRAHRSMMLSELTPCTGLTPARAIVIVTARPPAAIPPIPSHRPSPIHQVLFAVPFIYLFIIYLFIYHHPSRSPGPTHPIPITTIPIPIAPSSPPPARYHPHHPGPHRHPSPTHPHTHPLDSVHLSLGFITGRPL